MSSYENKKKLLFDCLTSAEQCIKGTSLEQIRSNRNEATESDGPKRIGKRFQGRESIFKRPAAPISKCLRPRHIPDYQTNPHKWKKYSLDDADISDRTNASAAIAFLAEMERRRDSEEPSALHSQNDDAMDTDANDMPSDKIAFKKQNNHSKEWQKPSFNKSVSLRRLIEHTDTQSNESVASEKPILKGSKVIMPEYVIGQKGTKNTKIKKLKLNTSGKTQAEDIKASKQPNQKPHLQHLFDDADENEDDDDDDGLNDN